MDLVGLPLVSSFFVLIALVHGAYWDIKTRTAPKWIWGKVAPVAAVPTFLLYCLLFQESGINGVLNLFLVSAILCPISVWMAYRMGNGGDWRAMFYVALLTPTVAMIAWLMAGVFGLMQVGVDEVREAPMKSAWMVSILGGFVVAVLLSVFYFTITI